MTAAEYAEEIKRWPIEKLVMEHRAGVLEGSTRLSESELKGRDYAIQNEMVRRAYSQAGVIWPPLASEPCL